MTLRCKSRWLNASWIISFLLGALPSFSGDKRLSKSAEFDVVDVGYGNAAFVISPSGETMLLDCGPPPSMDRIYDFMQQNGIKKVDYLVVTHYHADHMGAAPGLSEKVPILNFVDKGTDNVEYGKTDDWWKQRRPAYFSPGAAEGYNKSYDVYKAARAHSHHITVKLGDHIPIKGLDVMVVAGAGRELTSPLKGAGQPNPACSQVELRAEDDAEDGQSLGVLITYGKFRFVYLGDMDWNPSRRLFCPDNKIGTVDAYLVTHHAQSYPKSYDDYHWGLSCCSTAEVWGLHPRVAILSMGAQGHKGGDPLAMETIKKSPGLEQLWQTEKITAGGEMGHNAPDEYIANIGEPTTKVAAIRLTAQANGRFVVTNMRNGLHKEYVPKH